MKPFTFWKNRHGFSMIELIFVIIVIGILAALAIPRLERDIRQEAAINILSAIRYTQHLALIDDKTDPRDAQWQKKLWSIHFTNNSTHGGAYYVVGADNDQNGTIGKFSESAIDPANGKYMYHHNTNPIQQDESPNVILGKQYGINSITPSGGCTVKHIGFDHLGRPHVSLGGATNDYHTYMTSDCNLTFTFKNNSIDPLSIIIEKETGYAYIEGQGGS